MEKKNWKGAKPARESVKKYIEKDEATRANSRSLACFLRDDDLVELRCVEAKCLYCFCFCLKRKLRIYHFCFGEIEYYEITLSKCAAFEEVILRNKTYDATEFYKRASAGVG